MGNEADKKFTWVVKNFSSSQSAVTLSEKFVIGGCKWYLNLASPNGRKDNYFSLYLVVADYQTLPCGWKRNTKCRLTLVNQLSDKLSRQRDQQLWFDQKTCVYGSRTMITLTKLTAKNGGFVVNDEVKIVVEVDVLEVIGGLDVLVSEESQEVTQQPLKRTKLNHDGALLVSASVDVNGFQVLPSQAESVRLIFKKHPDMAIEFRAKNQHLRTSCINLLLNLIETLCQSLQNLSIDDLRQAEKTLAYLKNSGFKVDWLELKLEQAKKTKIEWQIGESRVQELEEKLKGFKKQCSYVEALLEKQKEELKDLKHKCSDTEVLLEKEKANVLAATRAPPLTLDDVV
ncbi:MATH domain and coiled-coil domain-containing protein [Cardamine amara subsp. amara]|uniref:MATH domain and coiled-coil domain-containing protein n=1 Tax=Cardamine amara subsp. amara TaxID=228776 RepID=A0ABD1A209_CARAN